MRKYLCVYVFVGLALMLAGCDSDKEEIEGFNSTKLDNYIEEIYQNQKLMGSIAISEKDKKIYSRAFGFADVENDILATPDTKYRVGSVTKTFTAVLILKAMEEKLLSLQQTLSEFYPSVVNADKITISDLLYHRTGIPDLTNDEDYMDWYLFPKTKEELIEHISGYESDFQPGSQYVYSNSNYILLTFILESLYQKTYEAILHEKILQPIHLLNTGVGGKIALGRKEANS